MRSGGWRLPSLPRTRVGPQLAYRQNKCEYECAPEDYTYQVYPVHVYVHNSHTDRTNAKANALRRMTLTKSTPYVCRSTTLIQTEPMRMRMRSGGWRLPSLPRTRVGPQLSLIKNQCECAPEDDAYQVYPVQVYVHNSHTDRTNYHHWRRGWRCRGVTGGLSRGTLDLSPATRRRFPMVLGDTVGATCALISSLDRATAVRTMRTSVLRGHP